MKRVTGEMAGRLVRVDTDKGEFVIIAAQGVHDLAGPEIDFLDPSRTRQPWCGLGCHHEDVAVDVPA